MDYHYQNIDPAIGERIDDEIRNLFNSSTQDGDRKDIREELTEKFAERVVDVYQKAIMDAYKVSGFPLEERGASAARLWVKGSPLHVCLTGTAGG